ncbi:hypothetical protein [Streptomyces smyrnaeus]
MSPQALRTDRALSRNRRRIFPNTAMSFLTSHPALLPALLPPTLLPLFC